MNAHEYGISELHWLLLARAALIPLWARAQDKSETRTNKGNHEVILMGAVEDYKCDSRSIVLRNCREVERCQKSEDRQMFSQGRKR